MFLYDFATKTAQKPDTVATYIRRNEKIFKNHVERREKQLWLDEKAVKILLKKYPEVQRKKYPWWKNETEFEQAMVNAIKGLHDNQQILQEQLDGMLIAIEELLYRMGGVIHSFVSDHCLLRPYTPFSFLTQMILQVSFFSSLKPYYKSHLKTVLLLTLYSYPHIKTALKLTINCTKTHNKLH